MTTPTPRMRELRERLARIVHDRTSDTKAAADLESMVRELMADLAAAQSELAAMKQLAEDANRDIFWLYTHCRAIGMVKEADKTAEWPRAIIRDICMFTIDLLQRAEAAEQQKRKD